MAFFQSKESNRLGALELLEYLWNLLRRSALGG